MTLGGIMWLNIYDCDTVKVSEEVNRKCPPRNMMVQLSTPYTDPETHSITDGQTTVLRPIADLTV